MLLRSLAACVEANMVYNTRHSTTIIPSLDPPIRQAAVESYGLSLRTVFWLQTGASVVTLLACLAIEENPLPDTMEEQAKRDDERHRRHSDAQDCPRD